MNAAATFVFGLSIEGLALWLNTNDAGAILVWACVVIGLVIAIPVSWFQLFDHDY